MRGTIGLRFPRLGISQFAAVPSGDADLFPTAGRLLCQDLSRRVDTPTPYTRDFFYRRDRLFVRTAKRFSPSVLSKHTARMMHAVELVVRRSEYLNGWSNVVGRQVACAGARPGVSLTVGGVRLPGNLENCYHYATCRPSGYSPFLARRRRHAIPTRSNRSKQDGNDRRRYAKRFCCGRRQASLCQRSRYGAEAGVNAQFLPGKRHPKSTIRPTCIDAMDPTWVFTTTYIRQSLIGRRSSTEHREWRFSPISLRLQANT